MPITYEIMHMDRCAALIDTMGKAKVLFPSFMPYVLWLESGDDLNIRIQNLENFHHWCASRMLTLDREHAKAILNSAGLSQAVTDKARAQVALSYRCLSLTDAFWVRQKGDKTRYNEVNLYENHLDKTFVDIALCGRQYTVENRYLARDLSTNGVYPKAWRRNGNGFELLKDGGDDAVDRELLASRICRCFEVDQVLYEEGSFDGERVTISRNFTSPAYSIADMEALEIRQTNRGSDLRSYVLKLDRKNYHMMNIVDYLVGNTDRHWGNWGVLVDNEHNYPRRLHDLMDFNQSFHAYETLDGANCLTTFGEKLSQKEAAVKAVHAIGLNQCCEVESSVFQRLPQYEAMFRQRLALLKSHCKP